MRSRKVVDRWTKGTNSKRHLHRKGFTEGADYTAQSGEIITFQFKN